MSINKQGLGILAGLAATMLGAKKLSESESSQLSYGDMPSDLKRQYRDSMGSFNQGSRSIIFMGMQQAEDCLSKAGWNLEEAKRICSQKFHGKDRELILNIIDQLYQEKKNGSFNDDDDNQIQRPGQYLMQMMQEQQRDPFLGEIVQREFRGRPIMNPEYTVIFDLVDAEKVPMPPELITTPEKPYGPRNSAELFRRLRPDMSGILKANMVCYLHKKSHFFAMVEAIKPMIEADGEVINLNDQGEVVQLLPPAGRQIIPRGNAVQRKYRINLFAQASFMGQPLFGAPVFPFSNLIYTFEMYGDRGLAEFAYDKAFAELQRFMNAHQIDQRNARRLH